MKVTVNDYSSTGKVMDLAKALTPYESEGGQIERLERLVERQSEIIGRLAALMVDNGWIDLSEASDLCGNYGQSIEAYLESEPEAPSKWALPRVVSSGFGGSICWGCGGSKCDGSCTEIP